MLTINLLQALPRTPLWDRLEREGRLVDDEERESNVEFLMPYDQLLAIWRDTMGRAYAPEAVFARYDHQLTHTFPNRIEVPVSLKTIPPRILLRGLRVLWAVLWRCGVRADYRRHFWKIARRCFKEGKIDNMIRVGIMSHHLIMSAREATAGRQRASHYSARPQDVPVPAE